jgi:hypothetical protein
MDTRKRKKYITGDAKVPGKMSDSIVFEEKMLES